MAGDVCNVPSRVWGIYSTVGDYFPQNVKETRSSIPLDSLADLAHNADCMREWVQDCRRGALQCSAAWARVAVWRRQKSELVQILP
jgi:hypothetical protein